MQAELNPKGSYTMDPSYRRIPPNPIPRAPINRQRYLQCSTFKPGSQTIESSSRSMSRASIITATRQQQQQPPSPPSPPLSQQRPPSLLSRSHLLSIPAIQPSPNYEP